MTDYFKALFSFLYLLFGGALVFDAMWDSRTHALQFYPILLFILAWTALALFLTYRMKRNWIRFGFLPVASLFIEPAFIHFVYMW